jgi:hypothetical protein
MKQALGFNIAVAIIFTTFITSCNNKKSIDTMETKRGITKAA